MNFPNLPRRPIPATTRNYILKCHESILLPKPYPLPSRALQTALTNSASYIYEANSKPRFKVIYLILLRIKKKKKSVPAKDSIQSTLITNSAFCITVMLGHNPSCLRPCGQPLYLQCSPFMSYALLCSCPPQLLP